MLTIFTIPKPFVGHFEIIQRNAIRSWLMLSQACEVILCGNEPGVAEAAADLHILHLPELACNEYGTPLLSSAFEQAQTVAHNETMCYANADIIFLSDLLVALACVPFPRYLMVGRRHDVDLTRSIDFSTTTWEQEMRSLATSAGVLQRSDFIDYFVFPRHAIQGIPAFAIGRTSFDNWLIYRARALGYPVIDATPAVTVVHQNHDYSHVQGGREAAFSGPEALRNRALMGGKAHGFRVTDATHKIDPPGRLSKALDAPYLERRASRAAVLSTRRDPLARFSHRLIGWIGRRRERFPLWLWQLLIDRLAP